MYYKVIKGKILPAPDNIRKLIGNPTPEQYLFFGYKPLSELDYLFEKDKYISDREEPETVER